MSGEENEKGLTAIQEKFLELFASRAYNISKTAKAVGVHRNTVLLWRKSNKQFEQAFLEKKMERVDTSEETLFLLAHGVKDIDKDGKFVGWKVMPHFQALKMDLEANGRDRGYGQRLEITKPKGEEDYEGKTEDEMLRELEKEMERYGERE